MYYKVHVFESLIVLLHWITTCKSSNSHWVVTQEGKINKQDGSPFDLHQSHNLFSLLEQERRIANLHYLHQTLLHQKHEFQEIVDLEGYLVDRSIPYPTDCMQIKQLWDHDFSLSTVVSLTEKDINHDDYLDPAPISMEDLPYCYKFSKLQAIQSSPVDAIQKILNDDILVGRPEPALIAPFYLQQNEFGNSVHQALERNSTSWVLYHLATIYWRSMGNAEEAVECIKRQFQFSLKSSYDIPLLHLSNLLHRSEYIHESLMPLKDAIYMSPESGVLFYTLGKIYISLGFLSQALRAFQTSLLYKYRYDHTLMLMESLQCEMKAKSTVHYNKNKIKVAYENLEEFYKLLGDTYHQQMTGTPLVLDEWIQLLYSTSYQYDNNYSWIHKTYHRSKKGQEEISFSEDFQSILEALLSELSILEEEEEIYSGTDLFKEKDLESALEDALLKQNRHHKDDIMSFTSSFGSKETATTPNLDVSTIKPSPSLIIKISNPNVPSVTRLVAPSQSSSCDISYNLSNDESHCPNLFLLTTCLGPTPTPLTNQISDNHLLEETNNIESSVEDKKSKYTEAYKQMEFIPYNALPQQLEEAVFSSSSPVIFNDPYWPNKRQCLELVEDASDHLPRFTGTFLTPEAREINFKELITGPPSLSENLQVPVCSEIIPLPYSMSTLDHLEGVSDRVLLIQKNISVEAGLRQLLISTVEDATGESFSFAQAADKLYHSLKEHKFNWALYNLASIYWRTLGDGYQSIECLRRGIDLAFFEDWDVGYIGLANVLHRHGYLENALITARAALDIRPISPVGHYTLAGIYLTCGDLVATNLHLRIVLNHQPNFKHALSALKLVRCSLKFKQEQKVLEQKQQLLLAQQQLKKDGHESTPDNLKETLAKLKLKQKKRKDELFPTEFVGEDAVRYITKTVINSKEVENRIKEKIKKNNVQPSRTLSREQLHDVTNLQKEKSVLVSPSKEPTYTMEYMAKDNEREEELRKKWPENLPWPSLEDCKRKPPAQYMVFTSTWLSVTAKKINITDYMDFNVLLNDSILSPICDINFELSEITLNHFEGMYKPALLDYIAEKGLEEVLCKLSGSYHPMDEMATRMRLAMISNDSNWVISNLAALYWRIVGNGEEAIQCLKHALYHAPLEHRDVAYVSLANVLYRSGYYENSASAMQLALETSPNLVVNHFTMANVLAGQGYYREAAGYYELVLYHQPEFGPASDRLRCVRCMIVFGENDISLKQLHHQDKPKGKKTPLEKMKELRKDRSTDV